MRHSEKPTDQLKRRAAAGLRALSADPKLEVNFQTGGGVVDGTNATLASPPYNPNLTQLAEMRGAADYLALEKRYHNQNLHQRFRPKGQEAAELFDMLEDARYVAKGSEFLLGVENNLNADYEKTWKKQGMDSLDLDAPEAYHWAVNIYARQLFGMQTIPPCAVGLYEYWKPRLEQKMAQGLKQLNLKKNNQKEFAKAATNFLRELLYDPIKDEQQQQDDQVGEDELPPDLPEQQHQQHEDENDNENQESKNDDNNSSNEQNKMLGEDELDSAELGEDGLDNVALTGERQEDYYPEHDLSNVPKEPFYKIYTTEFDEIIPADQLIETQDELEKLRNQLDEQMGHLTPMIGKLANRLQRRLMAQQLRAWEFDCEEGMLDTSRLPRIVMDPFQALAFKHEKATKFKDTVVTLLIDNSGSMRGRPISIAAISTDILTRTLERCQIKVEILGFTTSRWKGGMAREKWLKHRRPENPGRLNDLRHVIYKSADEPYRLARRKISLMLKDGLLKENIDGEALLWAHHRLLRRSEERRVLLVISDGAPVDDSTLSVNEGNYLERHLRDVINSIENKSSIELLAIGIGHDVTRYYNRAVTITDADQLAGTIMQELEMLFVENGRRAMQ